jgi:diaminopimelate decarboxylase
MSITNELDGCLSVHSNHLFIEACDTVELVKRFGSPLFVFSETQLRQNVRRFKKAFATWWTDGPVDILPAMKANTTLATRRILAQEGAGADIYSAGELLGALQTGTEPSLISVNGGGKSEAMIRTCIEAGVRITVEDVDEPELIEKVAAELGKVAKIRFRVKPNFPNLWKKTDFAQEYASIDLGIQLYKSGIPAQYLVEMGKKVFAMPHVELVGLHFHAGRHRPSLWYWQGLMRQYGRLIGELCRAWDGYKPEEIDIGGGFAIHRDPHNKMELQRDVVMSWLTWPGQLMMHLLGNRTRYWLLSTIIKLGFVKKLSPNRAPTVEAYAEMTVKTLRETLRNQGVDTSGIRLQLEPGRSLYGNTGVHLAVVKKVKHQTKPLPMTWVLLDTTTFFLTGGVYEYNLHHFCFANKMDAAPVQIADVVGHSCFGDRILPLVRVPDVHPGDVIALLDAGAYLESSASNFNALPRPATLLVHDDQAEVIKRAETIDDVYSRDSIPERLQ